MDQIIIVFAPGNYGNFVRWCIDYFSGGNDLLPFSDTGNSHNQRGKFKFSSKIIKDLKDIDLPIDILLRHPVYNDENFVDNIKKILSETNKKILLLNFSENSLLLSINNKFTKIWDEGWLEHHNPSSAKLFGKELKDFELWETREFLSYYIFKQHNSMNLRFLNKRILNILIDDLIDDFELTIKKIFDFINLKIERVDFDRIYSEWIKLQFHKDKDKITKEIVNAIINNNFLDWADKNLTTADEAWIQMELRDRYGIEIRCYGLNEFPTNTTALRKYLI